MMRRRLLLIDNEPTSYITDGLVLWLDGLNRGNVSGEWHDLIDSTNIVTLTGDYIELSNGIDFTGSDYGSFSKQLLINSNTGTIEICVEIKSLTNTLLPIVCMGGNFKLGSAVSYNTSYNGTQMRYYYSGSGSGGQTYIFNDTFSILTASANDDLAIANKYYEGYLVNSNFSSYIQKGFAIRGAGNQKFIGIIYAVRMYNRKLSKSEMINNQRMDNKRYNLGLNI